MLPHLARRDMARVDRRPPGSQQREEGRLRPLQMKGDLVVTIRGDLAEVPVPGFARIDAKRLLRLAGQHVPGAFDIAGREGLPSCHLTPRRNGKVNSVRSPFHDQPVARSGTIDCMLFRFTCWSNMTRLLNRHHGTLGENRRFPRGSTCLLGCRRQEISERPPAFAQMPPRRQTLRGAMDPLRRVLARFASFPLTSPVLAGSMRHHALRSPARPSTTTCCRPGPLVELLCRWRMPRDVTPLG